MVRTVVIQMLFSQLRRNEDQLRDEATLDRQDSLVADRVLHGHATEPCKPLKTVRNPLKIADHAFAHAVRERSRESTARTR
jgi:hypothetical protein